MTLGDENPRRDKSTLLPVGRPGCGFPWSWFISSWFPGQRSEKERQSAPGPS